MTFNWLILIYDINWELIKHRGTGYKCEAVCYVSLCVFSDMGNRQINFVANVSDTKNNNYFLASENLE